MREELTFLGIDTHRLPEKFAELASGSPELIAVLGDLGRYSCAASPLP